MAQSTTQDPPGLLEMETSSQTKNYRADRLKLWQLLQAKHKESRETAIKHGATEAAADEYASRTLRGEINVFIDELLTHTRKLEVLNFIMAAPREWGLRGELLLGADPLVPSLIARSYPVAAWVEKVDALDLAVAADAKSWRAWLGARLEALGEAGRTASEHVFGAVEHIGKGLGEGVGAVGQGIGKALMIGVGVLSLGAVVIGGIVVFRSTR